MADAEGIPVPEAVKILCEERASVTMDQVRALMERTEARRVELAQSDRITGAQAALDLAGMAWLNPSIQVGVHAAAVQEIAHRNFDLEWFTTRYRPAVGEFGRMTGRLVLPHYRDDHIVFYQGRLVVPSDEPEYDPPKYLNPKNETQILKRRELVWNETNLQLEVPAMVVVEGIFKACGVERAGYPAVATYGSMVSADQLNQIAACKAQVIIVAPDRGELDYEVQCRSGLRTFDALWRERVSKPLAAAGRTVYQITPPDADYDEVSVETLWQAVGSARPITGCYSL